MLSEIRKLQVWDRERRRLYVIPAGGSGEPPPAPGTPPGGGNPDPDPDPDPNAGEVTLSQERLNRMLAREKNQGRAAAEQALADELGMPLAEAKALLTAAREREDAAKTEAQRAAAQAADRESKAAEREAAAAKEQHETRVERALIRAGVKPPGDTDEERARFSRVARMVTAEVGAEYDAIVDDVEQVKADFPDLFAASGEGDPPPPRRTPSSDPVTTPPKRKHTEDAFSRGAERAKNHQSGGVTYEPRKADTPVT